MCAWPICASRVVGCRFTAPLARRVVGCRLSVVSRGLCEISATPSRRAPSPPRFSVGEKVAEGRMRGYLPLAPVELNPHRASGPRSACTSNATPPSSAFGTFSPRKARGEKALDERVRRESERSKGTCEPRTGTRGDQSSGHCLRQPTTDNGERAARRPNRQPTTRRQAHES